MTSWFHNIVGYEFEVSYETGTYTGWYRCIDGWRTDGRWPERHRDGRERYGLAPWRTR